MGYRCYRRALLIPVEKSPISWQWKLAVWRSFKYAIKWVCTMRIWSVKWKINFHFTRNFTSRNYAWRLTLRNLNVIASRCLDMKSETWNFGICRNIFIFRVESISPQPYPSIYASVNCGSGADCKGSISAFGTAIDLQACVDVLVHLCVSFGKLPSSFTGPSITK